ncbi:MAG TPA: LCP family protein [Cellulomonas sp.]
MAGRHDEAPRHARRLRGHGVARAVGLAVTAVLLFGTTAVAALGQRLQANLTTVDVSALVGPAPAASSSAVPGTPDQPGDPGAGRAMNILVIGSDQRDGENAAIGGADSTMASDTTIVVHLAADRSRVELVSIPRDSLVDIPSCTARNGRTTKPTPHAMINKAFDLGWEAGGDTASAIACTWRTVQSATGLTIDHAVAVDFVGFQAMVGAVGGVRICIPRELDDPKYTGLHLEPGWTVLDGSTALQFARARHGNIGNGDGTDLARLGNQQRLVAAIVDQVLSANVLANPAKLAAFLSAATASLTVDAGLSLSGLTGLVWGLRSVGPGDITLMTIPTAPAPENANRLVWSPEAAAVWANLSADRPVVQSDGTLSPAPGATSSSPPRSPSAPAPSSPSAAAGSSLSSPTTPVPARTRQAGAEPFTPADVTAVCG